MNDVYLIFFFFVTILWVALFSRGSGNLTKRDTLLPFAAGIIIAPVAGLISYFFQIIFIGEKPYMANGFHIYNFFLYFFIVGPVEEVFKFLAFFVTVIRNPRIKKSHDAIILSIITALGFAGAENLLYLKAYGWQMTLPRLILGNLGHAGYAVFWGYGFGAHLTEDAPYHLIWAGLLMASVLHGVYNYFLSFSYTSAIISLLLFMTVTFFMFRFLKIEKNR